MPLTGESRKPKKIELACPQCGFFNEVQDRECAQCGVDLALATGMAAFSLTFQSETSDSNIAPEILVPRLGEILIEKGLLKPEDEQKAANYQKAKIESGEACLFGKSLLALGLISREALDAVITEQILQLQSALQRSNLELEMRVEERTNDLQQALKKLSELNQLKSNFISNISHELRTPLTHLKGYLSLLEEGDLGGLNSEQVQAVDVMVRAENRLEQLIEDLIQFSLVARGELSLKKRSISVISLIKSISQRVDKLAKANQVEIKANLVDDIPNVFVDVEKISWVLLQLIDNAIKFSRPGGLVTIAVSRDRGLVQVRIKDQGIGMSDEKITEIFEPFHQLDGNATRQRGGTGLGLALVKRIIEAHGSKISVHSKPGEGSSFQFNLAVNDDA